MSHCQRSNASAVALDQTPGSDQSKPAKNYRDATNLPPLAPIVRDDAGGRPGYLVAGQVPRRDPQVVDPA
jgi:hypothetical protein